jgi:predicted dehydrogenase
LDVILTFKGVETLMVNYAIVGCGHIAKKHATAINSSENSQLVAVCDTVPERMEYYKEEFNVDTFTDFDALLKDERVNVINICTPSGLHAPLAVKAANAKKHIVVEKPIALTMEDANQIIDACQENGVKLAVVHPNRFRPVMMEMKKLLDDNVLGKISHANATVRWNRNQEYYDQAPWRGTKEFDGGVLMNQAIHNLDLLLWFMGDIDELYSMEATRLRNIESEDVSTGVIRFKSGALGVVEAATTIYPKNLEESISIFGENGTVVIGGPNAIKFEHLDIKALTDEEISAIKEQVEADPFGKPGHQWIIEDMSLAILEGREPIVNGQDGKKALELVTGFYSSAEKNAPLKF